MSDAEPAPVVKPERISIRVANNISGGEVYFQIKKTTTLKKLFSSFRQQAGLEENEVVFLYDGHRIDETQTPAEVKQYY